MKPIDIPMTPKMRAELKERMARMRRPTGASSRVSESDVQRYTPTRAAHFRAEILARLQAQREDDLARFRVQAEQRRRVELWQKSGVPARHTGKAKSGIDVRFWPEAVRPAVSRAFEVLDRDRGLGALVGPVGTGKTQLAASLCWWFCIGRGRSVHYSRWADLIARIRQQAYTEGGSDAKAMDWLARLGLLVIDEVHERRWSDDEALWLSRILEHRYGNLRPTLLITNLAPESLSEVLGSAVVDRMREGGAIIPVLGKSRRGAGDTSAGLEPIAAGSTP